MVNLNYITSSRSDWDLKRKTRGDGDRKERGKGVRKEDGEKEETKEGMDIFFDESLMTRKLQYARYER